MKDKNQEQLLAELILVNKELKLKCEEIEKRAAELVIANIELTLQDEEKRKRAAELILANIELAFQDEEKRKKAIELISVTKKLEELWSYFSFREMKMIELKKEVNALLIEAGHENRYPVS